MRTSSSPASSASARRPQRSSHKLGGVSQLLTAKGQATKARIVAAAADLVFKQGVAGTSIEDVRKAAGVSGSQMTHYFEDKKALIRAVVTHQADTILAVHQELGN